MQRNDYNNAREYGYTIGYHLAATATIDTAVCYAIELPANERESFYRGTISGAFAYHREHDSHA